MLEEFHDPRLIDQIETVVRKWQCLRVGQLKYRAPVLAVLFGKRDLAGRGVDAGVAYPADVVAELICQQAVKSTGATADIQHRTGVTIVETIADERGDPLQHLVELDAAGDHPRAIGLGDGCKVVDGVELCGQHLSLRVAASNTRL